ncbi:MAG: hypothetical protein IIY06_08220 [Proteobacteria bacterium]|nr:hypothetical protein [Pseudomonadota bacterium]
MTLLTEKARETAITFNTRARQIFWRGILPQTSPLLTMSGDEVIEWVCRYQQEHDLLVDGRLGPSTLIVMMAEERGGLGDPIIDGKPCHIDGLRVARMFVPGAQLAPVKPDLCCVLSQSELDRETRDRVRGTGGRVRAHFSIDSSRGAHGESLIIQWADPMREVPFCPVRETGDYPRTRQCIGIEVENITVLYQMDSDERRWLRRRTLVKAQIGPYMVSQPELYEEQILALERLMGVLCEHCGIERTYPKTEDGTYSTALLNGDELNAQKGYIARYNYFQQNSEPGSGFVVILERLFGKLETAEERAQKAQAEIRMDADAYLEKRAEAKAELDAAPQPTQAYSPHHEEDPRFSLSAAIAAAWQSGKAARGVRLAEKAKHFDADV